MNLTEDEKHHGKWFIAHRKINLSNVNTSNLSAILTNYLSCDNEFVYMHAPKGVFYADPICIENNNIYYVFFEYFDYKKGRLAYYTIDDNLNCSNIEMLDIDIQTHVSYPYIIKHNNEFYMCPETCHQNKINLYQCTEFPKTWRFKKTIVSNVHAGDNTIIKYNDLYWLFTLIYKNNTHYFSIYYSDDLLGEWKEHSLVNEHHPFFIRNDRITRGAGNIFVIDGKLIRPAQYSNGSVNGEGIILYEIKTLTKHDYTEIPLCIISREQFKSIRAMHTFSICNELLSLDSRLERIPDTAYFNFSTGEKMNEIKDSNFYVDHNVLKEAFSLNTSGNGKCYYETTINGVQYTGERLWDNEDPHSNTRWNLVRNCIEFDNKNVLEIGCNMGIMLSYLKKFRSIGHAVGVDQPDELLIQTNKRDTIKAAKLLAKAFNINDIEYKQIDINKESYESLLGTNFDVVIAMSIYKWVDDKERFLKYLANFKYVIYEGHESDEVEINRFTNLGFDHNILGKTQTGASYSTDDTRTVILFTKK